MKRIEEIDPNFQMDASLPSDYYYLDPRDEPFRIDGLTPNAERSYCRLPLEFLPECSEGVQVLAWNLAGGCIRFSTDSPGLNLLFELRDVAVAGHFSACGKSGMELFEETDEGSRSVGNILPQTNDGLGCKQMQTIHRPLPGGMRHYALYLPLYNGVKQLLLGFAPGSKVEAGRRPSLEKPLVFYGSSITEGGCASKTGSCYTSILARRLDAPQINLGFSGNARGEENMARYIASLPMSAFIYDYDHNAPTVDHLQATHEKFYQIIRQAQPDLPILMMSRPDFDGYYGNKIEESRRRRNVIIATYAHALAAGDRNVYFVDGEQFFGNRDRDLCTIDGCHPTDIGFLRMADCVEPVLRHALGL